MTEPAPVPARIGQTTAIEQSRAVAEVQAAVLVAMQYPRSVPSATYEMEQSCKRFALADKAFYEYDRGGKSVTGPTIYLAAEIARCWGNMQYGVWEMTRDDARGQSEMLAFAWDLQKNMRVASGFIVPHKRDKKGGAEDLESMRDIYENNANNGARRVREAIFRLLPRWYVDTAVDLCRQTLENGGGEPLDQRKAKMVGLFGGLGVSEADIRRRLGRPAGDWTEKDLADLGITYRSLQRRETTVEDAFPARAVTMEEIADGRKLAEQATAAAHKRATPAGDVAAPPASQPADAPAPPPPAASRQHAGETPADERRERNRMHAMLSGPALDLNKAAKRQDKLDFLSGLLDRVVASTDDLTGDEVRRVNAYLPSVTNAAEEDRPLLKADAIEHGRQLRAAAPPTPAPAPDANDANGGTK